jgi:hypothetical protein
MGCVWFEKLDVECDQNGLHVKMGLRERYRLGSDDQSLATPNVNTRSAPFAILQPQRNGKLQSLFYLQCI